MINIQLLSGKVETRKRWSFKILHMANISAIWKLNSTPMVTWHLGPAIPYCSTVQFPKIPWFFNKFSGWKSKWRSFPRLDELTSAKLHNILFYFAYFLACCCIVIKRFNCNVLVGLKLCRFPAFTTILSPFEVVRVWLLHTWQPVELCRSINKKVSENEHESGGTYTS